MVDWNSIQAIQRDGLAFSRLMHAMIGLYIWEWFISLDFDWQYLSGKKRFRWPMAFYFLNRYCLLFSMIGVIIALNVTTEINCQGLYTFNQCFGNAAIGFASINLSLRTMAVWSRKWYIVAPLVAIILGHWSLILHGILLKAIWITGTGCTIIETNSTMLAVTFIYSMVFDFVVLSLTAWKLMYPVTARTQLVKLIFNDGLIYFVIAFLANLMATIFMLLHLNPVMSIIANVPAVIASTIVACRAVRRLSNYSSGGPEMFASNTQGSSLALRAGGTILRPNMNSKLSPGEGVHVQMETFESPVDKSYIDYDAAAQIPKGELDAEAQPITHEFKYTPY